MEAAEAYEKAGDLKKALNAWSYGASAAMDHGGNYKNFEMEAERVKKLLKKAK